MKRFPISPQFEGLLKAARRISARSGAESVLILAEVPYDFKAVAAKIQQVVLDPVEFADCDSAPPKVVVASDKPDVQRAVVEDETDLITLLHEPQSRQVQISQAIIEGVADELLRSGSRIVALYAAFERDLIDTISLISLQEHLAKLTVRDLRRLKTKVPLETLRLVVDEAIEIGGEGREGKPVGTMFVVGDHRRVLKMSHEGVFDPFKGYKQAERNIRNPRVREALKELAQIDGAFIIGSDGVVHSAGRILDAPAEGLTLSSGLGARHWAAAAISKATDAISIAVSESTGTVRIFQDGFVVLRIEPMGRGMKWSDWESEPPADGA
jgi:DNA integrity scanning protein DisA with diadenylate cyclase activity